MCIKYKVYTTFFFFNDVDVKHAKIALGWKSREKKDCLLIHLSDTRQHYRDSGPRTPLPQVHSAVYYLDRHANFPSKHLLSAKLSHNYILTHRRRKRRGVLTILRPKISNIMQIIFLSCKCKYMPLPSPCH